MNMKRSEFYLTAIRNLGLLPAMMMQIKRRFGVSPLMTLTSKKLKFPIRIRRKTTDLDVFIQIMVGNEYRCLDNVDIAARLVVDLGANIGCASAYFLSRYPDCTVLAVEPDPANFQALTKNLEPYKNRVKTIQAAVWPHHEKIYFDTQSTSPGKEWARQVSRDTDAKVGDGVPIDTITIPELIKLSGFDRIALLKIDIEGAEKELFTIDVENWIGKIDNIVIEVHGEEASNAFHKGTLSQNFEFSRCDELTVCLRP
jgi:FkbM family methyltransferase